MGLNPFMPNGISHPYQLNESISVLWDVGWYFSFLFNFNREFCKQTVETLIRRSVWQRLAASDLVLHCLPMFQKRMIGLYGLNIVELSLCFNNVYNWLLMHFFFISNHSSLLFCDCTILC